jgi:glutamine amidotransferase
MNAVIVDYGMGNLGSVRRALEECGASPLVSADPADVAAASCVVVPGVGAFADGMEHLESRGLAGAVRKAAGEGTPVLGICLGMQLLADRGFEGGETRGLGLIAGEVRRLVPDAPGTRIPHVGWNEVSPRGEAAEGLFGGIPDRSDFYFVHSYAFRPARERDVAAVTPYCGSFVSAVASGNVFGVQFHPEKSSKRGFALLRNFLRLAQGAVRPC